MGYLKSKATHGFWDMEIFSIVTPVLQPCENLKDFMNEGNIIQYICTKVSVHEESARVPMIIKVPGKKPAVCHSFTELIDLYPTVAELAGLDYSEHLQGKSLVKTLDDPSYEVRDQAFSVTQGGKTFLIRTDKWAYIQYNEDGSAGME